MFFDFVPQGEAVPGYLVAVAVSCLQRAARARPSLRAVTCYSPPARPMSKESSAYKLFFQLNGHICRCGHSPPCKR